MFSRLSRGSLSGMGYGYGGELLSSGERKILERLRNTKDAVVFDVGANVGQYCKMAREVLAPTSHIYCFEPIAGTRDLLLANVAGLSLVSVLDYGLGAESGLLKLHLDQTAATTATAFGAALTAIGTRTKFTESVQIRRLDEVIASMGVPCIDLLKIDVEGFELAVIQGAGNLLKTGHIRAIQFEFGPFHIYSRTFLRDFYELLHPQYEFFRISENGLLPCGEWTPAHEVFLTTNYLAEWRG